jgi:hypothetical protein
MRDHAAQIEAALAQLASELARRLDREGWRRRSLAPGRLALFTRVVAGEFTAAVQVDRLSSVVLGGDAWPVALYVRFGCGYEPATALMPVLTLDPDAMLVDEPVAASDMATDVTLAGGGTIAETAAQIVDVIRRHGLRFAERHASVDALDAALSDRAQTPEDMEVELRPVLLAAAGRHDQARQLVEGYVSAGWESTDLPEYRRFVRQLQRWLDAGGPPIPPVEQTLSQLPPPLADPPRPSWNNARKEARDKQAAWDAVRAVARGKTHEELTTLLHAEYAARDAEVAPSAVAVGVEMLELDRQPFGRARRTLRAFSLLKSGGSDALNLFRYDGEPDPEWLQPPEHASYPVPSDGRRWAEVRINPNARDWLVRVSSEAPRRLGPIVLIDTWLTEEEVPEQAAARVVVHIGDMAVGTLSADAAREFVQDLTAAKFYDELVRVASRLTPPTHDTDGAIEIKLPGPR